MTSTSRELLDYEFASTLEAFSEARDREGSPLAMSYVGVERGGERRSDDFGSGDPAVDLRSVSKVVLSLTVGRLIDDGTRVRGEPLALSTPVAPLLERHFPGREQRSAWEHVELRHLLSNTIGHQDGFLFRKDLADLPERDYVRYALSAPIRHSPGSHFSYSNVGPYLVSVILQDALGAAVGSLASEYILGPLGINADWRNYGDYTAGCTGLMMSGSDLLKVAALVAHGGNHLGEQVVSGGWVTGATTTQVLSPGMYDPTRVFPKFSYGFGFWVCENGSYYTDGTDGQYLIVVPSLELIIVTTGSQPDMKPITRCLQPLLQAR